MSFTSEFKEFVSKGNVVDLAVGVVIGGVKAAVLHLHDHQQITYRHGGCETSGISGAQGQRNGTNR